MKCICGQNGANDVPRETQEEEGRREGKGGCNKGKKMAAGCLCACDYPCQQNPILAQLNGSISSRTILLKD